MGNFSEEMIFERKLVFKEYFSLFYVIRCVRRFREFIDFFTRFELKEVFGCLRVGQYIKVLDILVRVVSLQEKLTTYCFVMLVSFFCVMLVCYRDFERFAEVFAVGERVFQCLQVREGYRYYVSLLDVMIRLVYTLGKDFVSLQERLEESQYRKFTFLGFILKEFIVREYLY